MLLICATSVSTPASTPPYRPTASGIDSNSAISQNMKLRGDHSAAPVIARRLRAAVSSSSKLRRVQRHMNGYTLLPRGA